MDVARQHLQRVVTTSCHQTASDILPKAKYSAMDNNLQGSFTDKDGFAHSDGCSIMHVAAFQNAWRVQDIFRAVLRHNPTGAVQKMNHCGSYPLHIFMGQSRTIEREAVEVLLEAGNADIICSDDCHKDNPVSLLYKNTLRFRWAQSMDSSSGMEEAQISTNPDFNRALGVQTTNSGRVLSTIALIPPKAYRELSLLLIAEALGKASEHLTLHDIVAFPRCPPLLVRMLLSEAQFRKQVLQKDSLGRLPIHLASKSKSVETKFIPSRVLSLRWMSVVELLHATAASESHLQAEDNCGRLPLHYAVLHSDSASTIRFLYGAYPMALLVKDPVTGLFPAQSLAVNYHLGDDDNMEKADLSFELFTSSPSIVARQYACT